MLKKEEIMKKFCFSAIAGILMFLAAGAAAKSTMILNVNKGELPDDSNECNVSLTEENVAKEGEFSMKVEFNKAGWLGMFKPKKGSWSGFKKLKFIIVNPTDSVIKDVGFCVKGAKMTNTSENRKDFKFEIPAGKKEFTLNLVGEVCNDGKSPLDISQVYIWNFDNYADQKVSFYVQKVWLED